MTLPLPLIVAGDEMANGFKKPDAEGTITIAIVVGALVILFLLRKGFKGVI